MLKKLISENSFPQLDSESVKKGENRTGYFNGLVHLNLNEIHSFTDDYGRKGIVIPLKEKKNLVVFQRYKNNENILALNGPVEIERALGCRFEEDDIMLIEAIINKNITAEIREKFLKAKIDQCAFEAPKYYIDNIEAMFEYIA